MMAEVFVYSTTSAIVLGVQIIHSEISKQKVN